MAKPSKSRKGGTPTPRIGISGWTYPGWRSGFYAGVPQAHWLSYCAEHFTAIEANGTFYRQVSAKAFARWRDETPDDFVFAIKGHRFVTHMKRLKSPLQPVLRQRRQTLALMPKLAAVVWQLPSAMRKDLHRLQSFLNALDRWPETRHAIEFRDPSWFDDDIATALAEHRVANCLSDAADWPLWDAVTTDLVYVRLHGHSDTYASRYSRKSLQRWAKRIETWRREKRQVHVYFDNDANGAAPYDAMTLMELTGVSTLVDKKR